MALEETVDLDISAALEAIDNIGAALTSVATGFNADLSAAISEASQTTLEVNADASAVTADIDQAVTSADGQVEAQLADPNTITDEIDQSVKSIDGSLDVQIADPSSITDDITAAVQEADTTIDPQVDTSGIDQLTQSSDSATQSLGGLEGASKGVDVAAGLAGGEISALSSGAGALGGTAGIAAAGIGTVIGASDKLFQKALGLNEAEFRFNTILGDQAAVVDKVNIGGLNTNVKDLALSVGGSNEALRNADANIFQLGVSSGIAAPQVSKTVDQIDALAARAVALKPSLGDVGDVADGMTKALARGGRFAAGFGLSLTSADINARALADTGKSVASELTIYEKSAAGAALATERLGGQLGQDVATGAASATVQFKSMKAQIEETLAEIGKPLIPIFIQSLKELGPSIVQAAQDFADFGKVILPLIDTVLPLLTAALKVIDAPLKAVSAGVKNAVDAYDNLPGPIKDAAKASIDILNPLTDSAKATSNLPGPLKEVGRAALDMVNPIAGVHDVLGLVTGSSDKANESFKKNASELEAIGVPAKEANSLFGQMAHATDLLNPSTRAAAQASKDHAAALQKEADGSKAEQAAEAQRIGTIQTQNKAITDAIAAQEGALSPLDSTFQTLGKNAQDVIDTFANGIPTQQDYKRIMDETGLSLQQLDPIQKAVLAEVSAGSDAAAKSVDSLGLAIEDLKKKPTESLRSFVQDYQKHATDMATFNDNIAQLIQRGAVNLADALIKAGPEAGAAAAASAKKISDKQLADLESQYATAAKEDDANTARAKANYLQVEKDTDLHDQAMKSKGQTAAQQDKILNDQAIADDLKHWQTVYANAKTEREKEYASQQVWLLEEQKLFSGGFGNIGKSIGDGIGDLLGIGHQKGEDMIKGVTEGLKSAPQIASLKQAASDAANAIHSAFNPKFLFGSPSKVMKQRGQQIVEGLALGLKETAAVSEASSRLADAVVQPMKISPVTVANSASIQQLKTTAFNPLPLNGGSTVTVAQGAVQMHITGPVNQDTLPQVKQFVSDQFNQLFNEIRVR